MKLTFAALALLIMFGAADAKDSALMRRLRRATAGLTYVSETDSHFRVVRKSPAFVRRARRENPCMPRSLEDFFEGQYADRSRRDLHRLRRLARLVNSNLRGVRVYWTGAEPTYRVYILGRTRWGAVLGLSVLVVAS
jgi:hypothetical protein